MIHHPIIGTGNVRRSSRLTVTDQILSELRFILQGYRTTDLPNIRLRVLSAARQKTGRRK